jgi:lipopolysaccharide assembly outer membrane protein LptD (OstA)
MTRSRAIVLLEVLLLFAGLSSSAQQDSGWEIEALTPNGGVVYDFKTGLATATNRVLVKYNGTVLTADSVSANQETGEAVADGNVRIQQEDLLWVGEHIQYNFKTHQMASDHFRAGRMPVFIDGRGLQGDVTNHVYNATNAFVTTDDVSNPFVRIRAHHIRIIPGKRIEATHAVLYVKDIPVFYFPYYSRNLGDRANNFSVTPGYRSSFGPFLLGTYTWFLNDQFDGNLHLDYRQTRGVGGGPDLNYHFGRWGEGSIRYYYTRDDDPGTNVGGARIPDNRQRMYSAYQASPFTNMEVRSLVQYQSDSKIIKDFFEGDYRENPQLTSYVEANRFWRNFSLDTLVQPRVNPFFETVERLPDIRLTGFRQQVPGLPVYYESETSAGYYRHLFVGTNSPFPSSTNGFTGFPGLADQTPPNFSAERVDTYHQLTLPETLFGWLTLTPRVGGRFTYYSAVDVDGGGATYRTNSDTARGVFNTGAELSFKASRLWPQTRSRALDLDGLRHIVEPSLNYVFVPTPNYAPSQVPQFDSEMPSLRPLPIDYPEYNSIDSIDSQNVLRFGLRNKLQTKRDGQIDDFVNWELLADWRLKPRTNQTTFADLYSNLSIKPRSWVTLQSEIRYDINDQYWRMLLHTITFEPNDTWSWSIGHFYLRDDFSASPTALGQGNNLIRSSLFYRLNENWGLRATHHFDARDGRMLEQYYTVYRDMRSWTAALSVGLRDNGSGPKDFTIALTYSIKAKPKFGVGGDTVRPFSLLGSD